MHDRERSRGAALWALAFTLGIAPLGTGSLHAQGLPGTNITPDQAAQLLQQRPELLSQLRQRLQQSGMTTDDIRQQLAARGYSPSLLDSFLGIDTTGNKSISPDMVRALEILGVQPFSPQNADSLAAWLALHPDTGLMGLRAPQSRLFGLGVFRGATTRFQPLLAGPVPDDYRIGPGDVMVLVLTGDAEQVHQLTVTREGFIVIPQIGQLFVNQLTMRELRQVLLTRLSRAFSGIPRGTTHFDVTIARLRTIQVFVIGDVARPGAYQLASVATVLNALYAAGGPTELGNFRQIEVQRGRQVVATLDLYEYLLRGSSANDIVLQQGDVVFVPVHGSRVSVVGAIVRPALYELKEGETLSDIVTMAGGFRPDAQLQRMAVFRILPPGERRPGPMPRAVVDVPLAPPPAEGRDGERSLSAVAAGVPGLRLEPGDSVVVDSILPPEKSLTVSIGGTVNKPGSFPWTEGMTVRDLVRLARGPSVGADLREAEVARLAPDRADGTLATTFRVPLDSTFLFERDSSGAYLGPPGLAFPAPGTARETVLQPYDHVTIFLQPGFELQRTVWITGQVKLPGRYALERKDERVSDLVRRAGGFLGAAYLDGARFYRTADSTGRVDLNLAAALNRRGNAPDLVLLNGDSLDVPERLGTVKVMGAVNSPVTVRYVEGMDLDYYIGNAGGYAPRADKGRVSVRYADGSARVRSSFLFFRSYPRPGPGSTVLVPSKVPGQRGGIDPAVIFAGLAQVLSVVTTIIIVSKQ